LKQASAISDASSSSSNSDVTEPASASSSSASSDSLPCYPTVTSSTLSYKEIALLGHARTSLHKVLASRPMLVARLEAVLREEAEAGEIEAAEKEARPNPVLSLADLPADLLVCVADHTRTEDLPNFGRVCKAWRDVSTSFNLFARRQLCCFHTKCCFGGDGVVLGVGLNLELRSDGCLKEVASPFDLMSEAAFSEDRVRLSVWKLPFTHFLPLAISAQHFQKAIPYLERVTKQAFGQQAKTTDLFELLAAAMNSMVVHLFQSTHDGLPPLHASEVALDGYCGFHHLLLSAANRWPAIRAEADRRVKCFLSTEGGRHKSSTPCLGRLLVALTLSSKGWSALCYPFLREALARNVLWVLRKKPFLETTSPQRASQTFEASLTSQRLIAFQIFFLNLVGRPAGTTGPEDVLAGYERRLGRPTSMQRSQLQGMAKHILELSTWTEFFVLVGANRPDSTTLHSLLIDAIASSAAKGYHQPRVQSRRGGAGGGGVRRGRP